MATTNNDDPSSGGAETLCTAVIVMAVSWLWHSLRKLGTRDQAARERHYQRCSWWGGNVRGLPYEIRYTAITFAWLFAAVGLYFFMRHASVALWEDVSPWAWLVVATAIAGPAMWATGEAAYLGVNRPFFALACYISCFFLNLVTLAYLFMDGAWLAFGLYIVLPWLTLFFAVDPWTAVRMGFSLPSDDAPAAAPQRDVNATNAKEE